MYVTFNDFKHDIQNHKQPPSDVPRRGVSGSTLKILAVLTMLIDHVAAVLIVRILIDRGVLALVTQNGSKVMMLLAADNTGLLDCYQLMRNIGRIAFPIYCFMLVEGFMRTGTLRKYMLRMFSVAVLSEIPFDLAFAGRLVYWEYQNVMFTLCLGLLAMYVSRKMEERAEKWFVRCPLVLLIWLITMLAAEGIASDYGAKGILCIAVLYVFRYVRELQLLGGALSFIWELPAPFAFLFIAFYNGRRGRAMKYFFYGFYPVHLLLLYGISAALGMGTIGVIAF